MSIKFSEQYIQEIYDSLPNEVPLNCATKALTITKQHFINWLKSFTQTEGMGYIWYTKDLLPLRL